MPNLGLTRPGQAGLLGRSGTEISTPQAHQSEPEKVLNKDPLGRLTGPSSAGSGTHYLHISIVYYVYAISLPCIHLMPTSQKGQKGRKDYLMTVHEGCDTR